MTHTLPAVSVPAGSRIGFTGHRDTAPDPHAMAVRVDWAPDSAGAAPGAPLVSTDDWEVARVSGAFASTFATDAAPAEWARVVDVSHAVSVETKREAPAGALHVAAAEPDKDPDAKFWVAFRSPPTPAEGSCSSAAKGDSGSSLSSGATAAVSIVSVVLVLAVIGGVVWVLSARRRRRMRAIDESEEGWPSKPASGDGGADKLGDGGEGEIGGGPKASPVAPPASDQPPYKVGSNSRGGVSGRGGGSGGDTPSASPGDRLTGARIKPLSVATLGSQPGDARSSVEDIRTQALVARALEADVVAASEVLYEGAAAAGERGGVHGGGGGPVAANGAGHSTTGGSDSRGVVGKLSHPGEMRLSPLTVTVSSGDTLTLDSGSVVTGSLVSSAEPPALASPPRVKRGVVLPDDDGLSPPPLPPSLWTPLPSPGV